MAPGGFRPCRFLCHSLSCSSCRNSLPTDLVEDELARDPGPIRGSHSGSTSSAPSCNPIPGLDQVPAWILASAFAPAPINKLFKKFMKAYLESNQGPGQPLVECERLLKAKISKVYYSKSHIDCYHFCQQCQDHFETAGATRINRTSFTVFFFCGNLSVR